jgi:hypothetical protein
MVTIGEKTKKIVALFESGISVEEIATQFNISVNSVNKRLKSFSKIQQGFYNPKSPNYKLDYVVPVTWPLEQIKDGFDRFIKEHGRLPTAYEVDDTPYLPSSRQIQRRFGGLNKLRQELGYGDIHFGKGEHRGDRSRSTGLRGSAAEDELEKLLVARFGELFVQSEKRFGNNRNRIDFVIYAKDALIGIDVFATDEKRTIVKNVAIKIPKYKSFPADVPLYFVVWSEQISDVEIESAVANMSSMALLPNLMVTGVADLMKNLSTYTPLAPPENYLPFPHPSA